MRLTFLGANRQVTGSRYCLDVGRTRVMIDCGLFQEREFAHRNWEPCSIPADSVQALLLTHAHIDHSGLIPKYVKDGFSHRIYATHPTVDLAEIMLTDSAEIQMEDARYKQKRHRREGRSASRTEQPLYELDDARQALKLFRGVDYGERLKLSDELSVIYHDAGHILGSATLELIAVEAGETRRIVFSGDIGQWDKPLIEDPSLIDHADYVVMESTYGDKDHAKHGDPEAVLEGIINETAQRNGKVIIPTFAVERAQELMFHISRLVHTDRIPPMPVFLDSPMAVDVTDIFVRFEHWLDEETRRLLHSEEPPLRFPGLVMAQSSDESRAINRVKGPCIIMSTSGMCTSGRIKHHLQRNISDAANTILFVGYQGHGTLGRQILDGASRVRIHGRMHKTAAQVQRINGFSAHADRSNLLRWLGGFDAKPRRLFLTHGEESVSLEFAAGLRRELDLDVEVPQYDSAYDLP